MDGLRGVAIASVLLYHSNIYRNGLFGVDAFFVLSGFLVTLVLIRELDRRDRIALGVFYRRRAKRLLPGLLATVLLVVGLSALFSPLKDAEGLRPKALAALAQVANWAQLGRGGSYWEHYAGIDPFAAMWSLSITEQFYLVWPVLLIIVYGLCRRSLTAAGAVTGGLFLVSAAVAPLLWNGENTDRLYLGTETRAVGFAAGATAAFVVYLRQRRTHLAGTAGRAAGEGRSRAAGKGGTLGRTLLGTAALAGLVAASVAIDDYHEPLLYQGGLAAVAVLAALLTASLCHERGLLVRLLSFKPFVLTGAISYSLYLLHLPVYWTVQRFVDDVSPELLLAIGAPVSWVLAWLLHLATERVRVLRWRPLPTIPLLAAATLAATAGAWFLPSWIDRDMRSGPDQKPLVVALGDSFSRDLATGLYRFGDRYRVVDAGIGGCGVFGSDLVRGTSRIEFETSPDCRDRVDFWRQKLETDGVQAVVVHLGWDAAEQHLDGTWLDACNDDYRTQYATRLGETVELVQRHAPGARILLMNERVENGAINRTWGTCYNKQIANFVKSAGGAVELLDLNSFYCPKDSCRWKDEEGHLLTPAWDGVHLTPAGMRVVTPWLESRIGEVLARPAPVVTPQPQPTTAETTERPAAPAPTGSGQPSPKPSTSAKPGGQPSASTRPATPRASSTARPTSTGQPAAG
ncbi:acyltransferase family protein [Kitasatospora sp. NPDC054939]